jgi:xanthine dehydrogenase accessory factor
MADADAARRKQTTVSPIVLIRGAGEMASAIAWRLHMSNIRRVVMTDLDQPLCVRRTVSFCTAIPEGEAVVEGVRARSVQRQAGLERAWEEGLIAVAAQGRWRDLAAVRPDVVIDAILAKRNIATRIDDAPLVIALGPGFTAQRDCHFVIETNRGHNLGRIIDRGCGEPNTGAPGDIAGHTHARVFRAPADGIFVSERKIGERVAEGECIGRVADRPVVAALGGIIRGLIASGVAVTAGLKLGDIDPRAKPDYCDTISDKARAIAGSALECVMRRYNRSTEQVLGGRDRSLAM